MKITDEIGYKTAIERLEILEGIVTEETPSTDPNYIELDALIDAIDAYEEEVYPIAKPTLAATIKLRMYEMGLTQTALSKMLGVSTSAIRRYLSGQTEPTLPVARRISSSLNISPSIVLGV